MKNIINTILLSTILLLTGFNSVFAQTNNMSNIRKLKLEIVLTEMNLNKETEKKFLPLYIKYSDETLVIKRKLRSLEDNTGNENPERKIQERETYKQEILNIEKRYKGQFLKIITPAQLDNMYKGEEKFRQTLLELKEKK
jgi:hypothetical protein